MRANVKTLLFLTILVIAALPLLAAVYFVDSTLKTSLDLGFNRDIVAALDSGSRNLRQLKTLDPANEAAYREQFAELERLRHVYAEPELIKRNLLDSLKIYFLLGVLAAILLSVAVALFLSRRIASAYNETFDELMRQQDRVRYLEEISSWQEMAKMLAHEIKNPLTPIEVLVTSLSKSFAKKSAEEFREQLTHTERMISEELGHLKNTVVKFSEFARLPQVALVNTPLQPALEQIVASLASALGATIDLDPAASTTRVALDPTLFRQVIANIVRNGIEANPGRPTRFAITLDVHANEAHVRIANDGVPVAREIASRIFDPYISTKAGGQNMGLGLAIVRKIVLEHGGDIRYEECDAHPSFVITLPTVS
jgi:signal transduction histidine kinase